MIILRKLYMQMILMAQKRENMIQFMELAATMEIKIR